jgi:hypothetical protein
MPTTAIQQTRKPAVRHYDFEAGHYTDRQLEVPDFAALAPTLQRDYKRIDCRGLRRWMRDTGLTTREAFRALGFDPRLIGGREVGDLITDTNVRPWFGPYIVEQFELGMSGVTIDWESLIAKTTPVDRQLVQWWHLADAETAADYTLETVAQGTSIPTAVLTLATETIRLWKSGRGLRITREAMSAPVDLVAIWLQVLGKRLGRRKVQQVANISLNGYLADNSDDPTVIPTAVQGTFSLGDLLTGADTLVTINGYNVTDILMSPARHIQMLTMQWPNSGWPIFEDDAAIAAKLGGTPHVIPGFDDNVMVFQDSSAALMRYVHDEFGTENDYDAETQVYATFGSEEDGFAPTPGIYPARVAVDAR